MNQSKIWLSSPHIGGTEQKRIQEAFDANWVAPIVQTYAPTTYF
jgi:dTDP-4-amino-4,6-dideoxygalactose transaminase